ncbi:SBBP repeat-containing protein, partial [Pelosinus baikalensis]
TKLNSTGNALVYSTYLGGSNSDTGLGIAIDTSDNAYVTGLTESLDFPTTPGAFQTSEGGRDAFITRLNSAGSALVYSTYLGGSSSDIGSGIAVDSSGNAYVTGSTQSTDFPTTPDAFQTSLKGQQNAFVAKLQTFPNGTLTFGIKID